jgi:hypothetical protein
MMKFWFTVKLTAISSLQRIDLQYIGMKQLIIPSKSLFLRGFGKKFIATANLSKD